jgi:hypothetical protein
MSPAISSLRALMTSPMRRNTSPRAGAGALRHCSKPRLADATARSISASVDNGKWPMTSVVSAGFRFSKYCLVEGSTQWPAMKFLWVFI